MPESASAETTGLVPSGDVQIFFRRFGKRAGKTPLLIAHGLSYFSYDWIPVASQLAEDREVVAFDLRGFGDSSWSESRAYDLSDFSSDIVALLDHLGWSDAVLIGHSMGGRICLATAGWQPDRVRALVCLDFAPDVEAPGRRKVAERIGNQPDRFTSVDAALAYHGYRDVAPQSQLRKRWEAFLRVGPDGLTLKRDLYFRDSFREVLLTGKPQASPIDLWAMLRGLRMPSLFVRGAESDMFASETMDKLRAGNDRASVVQIAGSHALMDDNPAGLVAEVRQFLATIR
ncbi:MAG: alpha/beta fold hydrolase [Lautropia sp.]